MSTLKLGLVHTGIAALDLRYAEICRDALLEKLRELRLEVATYDRAVTESKDALSAAERMRKADIDLLVVLVGTFTQDPVIANLVQNVHVPFVLWAVPEPSLKEPPGDLTRSGALVGVIMNSSALTKMGIRFKVQEWNIRYIRLVSEVGGADVVIHRAWYESFWSPRLFRTFFAPRIREEIESVHRIGSKFCYVMSSGIMPLLEILADLGIDILYGMSMVEGSYFRRLTSCLRTLGGRTL